MKHKTFIFIYLFLFSIMLCACGSSTDGSNGDYPVDIGDSYEDVYKYCEKHAVGEVHSYDEVSEPSIWADLDWFGDGDIYEVWFTEQGRNPEVGGIDYINFSVKTDKDHNKDDIETLEEKLIEKHGSPIDYSVSGLSDNDIAWIDGELGIILYYFPDDQRIDVAYFSYEDTILDKNKSYNYDSENDSEHDDWDTDNNGEAD